MEAFQNIGLNGYFKRYGYKYGITRGLFMASPIHIVKEYDNRKLLYYRKVRNQIKKYLRSALVEPQGLEFGNCEVDNPIWVYWKQGLENAPDLVKACVSSIQKHTNREVIILTEENSVNYVMLPEYILDKMKRGTMSTAHFSDLLRFSLLEHFGGTWIDATVLLSGELPQYITESDFFAYRDSYGPIDNPALISIWLMHSKKHNSIVYKARNVMFEYWKKEKYVRDYLIIYIVLTLLIEQNDDENMIFPYASSEYSYLMLKELGNEFCEQKYKHITELSNVHKLSYKLKPEVVELKNSLYWKIINGD